MTDAIVVLCTCPDQISADKICDALLTARLAACINQLPAVQSVYHWQGRIERASEIQLVIKSFSSHFEALSHCICQHHPYTVPEIIALPIEAGHQPYLDWLQQEVR